MEKELKYFICLFKMEGHSTFRLVVGQDIGTVENQLKNQLGKNKVVEKRFIEIDRFTGDFEEF